MANEPHESNEKRPPSGPRENAQAEHEGSSHSPEEFDVMNPERIKGKKNSDIQEQQ